MSDSIDWQEYRKQIVALEDESSGLRSENQRLKDRAAAWENDAAEFCNGQEFYRETLREVARLMPRSFRDKCYVSDDGSVQDEPLALKIPEVVKSLGEENQRLAERVAELEKMFTDFNTASTQILQEKESRLTEACELLKIAETVLYASGHQVCSEQIGSFLARQEGRDVT